MFPNLILWDLGSAVKRISVGVVSAAATIATAAQHDTIIPVSTSALGFIV